MTRAESSPTASSVAETSIAILDRSQETQQRQAGGRGPVVGAAAGGTVAAAAAAAAATAPAPVSRYHSDFRGEQRLGKGGYGVVVSAINGATICTRILWSMLPVLRPVLFLLRPCCF
jgi:hypothetical protein